MIKEWFEDGKEDFFVYDIKEYSYCADCSLLFLYRNQLFTDTLTKPLRKCVSMVVVPVQKGMNNIGLWVYDKYQTLQEISVVLEENKDLQNQVDALTEENNQLKRGFL